jgi:hypothetical protein
MKKSKRQSSRSLREKRDKLLVEMSSLVYLIRGSYFERFSTCARPDCRCHQGHRHGPRAYVAVTEEKRQRQHYVPRAQEKAVQRGVAQYHRLLEIITEITAINLELMRQGQLSDDVL